MLSSSFKTATALLVLLSRFQTACALAFLPRRIASSSIVTLRSQVGSWCVVKRAVRIVRKRLMKGGNPRFRKAHFCDLHHSRRPAPCLLFEEEGGHRWRLSWPILSIRDWSSARTPCCCWAFCGAALRSAFSARCPTTSPTGSALGDTHILALTKAPSHRPARPR